VVQGEKCIVSNCVPFIATPSLTASRTQEEFVADLLVRGIDEAVVEALRERARASGRSAEAEHREILASVLVRPHKRSFAEVMAAMPNVGRDSDFERLNDTADEAQRVRPSRHRRPSTPHGTRTE
jgi:antitoxin FitA